MSFDNTNKGQIWGNDKKLTEKHPDFKGDANIDGVEYWISAWKRDPNGNPKAPSLRFSFEKKQAPSQHNKSTQFAGTQNADPFANAPDFSDVPLDDSIHF